MKVGDLVTINVFEFSWATVGIGLIVEVGVYPRRRDTKILWSTGEVTTAKTKHLTLINPGVVPKTNLMKNNDNKRKRLSS